LINPTRRAALGTVAAIATAPDAFAQDKPLRIILGVPPGASADAITRMVGEKMAKTLGRSVIVENKTGAGGIVANMAARSAYAAKANATTLAVIREVQQSGIVTLAGIARTLKARGIKTPAGRAGWQPVQVSRLLAPKPQVKRPPQGAFQPSFCPYPILSPI
jgi:hypothetical protein